MHIVNVCDVYRERVLNTTSLESNIQHLKPSTKYEFRVVAYNMAGPSSHAASITIEMQPEGTHKLVVLLQHVVFCDLPICEGCVSLVSVLCALNHKKYLGLFILKSVICIRFFTQ